MILKNKSLNWGILGLGKIAGQFVNDLKLIEDVSVVACASRSMSNAINFAGQHEIGRSYGSYQELFKDDEVEIIYIATTHDSHAELSIEAMKNGKHVLCEKPLAINRKDVQRMVEVSRKCNVFLMEAFWARFNPTVRAVLNQIKNNSIGEVNYLNVDFTFARNDADDSRMLNLEIGGGSLMDMGVYPVFLAYVIFGKPEQILAASRMHTTGVDLQTSAIFKYKNGMANIMSGFVSQSDMMARIYGTEGRIFIDPVWHESEGYTLIKGNKGDKNGYEKNKYTLPKFGKGYTYEIEECKKCLSQHKIESNLWSHQNSLDLIEITDEIRGQIGLKYPFE
ncbi:Gfo/Idh/MocA family oxidoreductase [Saprospiraceae bacterium]|nr:Gfo/Idh/MocA family oxidoreductase [Saprospiraceae bacterium]